MTPLDRVLSALDAAGCGTKRVGRSFTARCPAHDDTTPSLTINEGREQPVLLHCHAQCRVDDILAALGLTWGDVCAPNGDRPSKAGEPIDTYVYVDEKGRTLYRCVKYLQPNGRKTFRQHKWLGDGTWHHSLDDARRVLYRLPQLLAAIDAGELVWIAEGEKDVERLRSEGATATCNPMGAGSWRPEFTEVLANTKVTIVADRDLEGAKHAHHVAASLMFAGATVTIREAAEGKDAADHFAAGHGLDDFVPVTLDELHARINGSTDDASGSEPSESSEAEWTSPLPIGRADQKLPAFPTETLPPWLREFVEAVAEAMQVPVDLPGMLTLSVLAAAAGGRAKVEVREGFREPVNLYTGTAMDPGERKTPVFNRCTAPLADAEQAATDETRREIAEAEARRTVAQAQAKDSQDRANRASDAERDMATRDAAAMRLMAESITVPVMPRLLADDATPEALASLMAEQNGRMAILSDEGDIFSMMAGRYSKNGGPNLAVYLKGHAGSRLRVDRKGRDPEYIRSPALTLGLAVQPEVLRNLVEMMPSARGLGLLGRFLWSIPTSKMGRRKIGTPPVPAEVGQRYHDTVVLLVQTLAEWVDPYILTLSPDAHARLLAFETEIEPRLGPSGDLHHVTDWASKLVGHTARIAGLLHLARNARAGWGFAIEADTIEAAVELAHYFVAHALAVFDLIGADPTMARARKVARWIKGREDPTAPFTRRDAHQAHRSDFPRADDIDPVLELLEDHEYIRRRAVEKSGAKGGRRPSPTFDVNPLIP